MQRRQVLAAFGAGTIPIAGVLATTEFGETPPDTQTPSTDAGVEITAPPVKPGQKAMIEIDASPVSHLRFSDVPDTGVTVEYENAEFSPAPTVVWQAKPPTRQWSPAEAITGEVPVGVSDTARPGDYQFAIGVQRDEEEEEEEELIETVTLPVEG